MKHEPLLNKTKILGRSRADLNTKGDEYFEFLELQDQEQESDQQGMDEEGGDSGGEADEAAEFHPRPLKRSRKGKDFISFIMLPSVNIAISKGLYLCTVL